VSLPHHVSRETIARDRGHAFGAAQRDAIDNTIRVYRRMIEGVDLQAAGEAVAAQLPAHHVEELEGMAAGAGQDPRELFAVNARTELLAGSRSVECSVVGRLAGRRATLAQTWDWHPDLAPSRVLWTVHHGDGAWFTTATEAGVLAKLGLNHHGVACALNLLTCTADGGTDGTPIHVLLRLVLEQAHDAEAAAELLRAARITASSAITLASPGRLVAVELSPGGAVRLEPGDDGVLVHTNHFLAPPPAGGDDSEEGTRLRRDEVLRLLRDGATPSEALNSRLPEEQPVCRYADESEPWADRVATLLTLQLDPGAPSLAIAAGPLCDAPLESVALPVAAPA
jgi:isopenicillin-N N-acyltransferase-like protein